MKRLKKLLFNSSESIDFLFTGLLIYLVVKLIEYYSPAFMSGIPTVYYNGFAIILLILVVQLGSLPFLRSNLYRLLNEDDKVDIRFNDGASFDDKNFVIKSGSISRIYKDIPPINFSSYFLLNDEKYWLADVTTDNGSSCIVPLDFVFKVRSK
jgi:hypothetical protein